MASLLVGAAQWRRQRIINRAEYFAQYDIHVVLPSAWFDRLWQRRPNRAVIRVPSDRYSFDDDALNKRLTAIGVTDLAYSVQNIETDWQDAMDIVH
jgi:hypothetical protein